MKGVFSNTLARWSLAMLLISMLFASVASEGQSVESRKPQWATVLMGQRPDVERLRELVRGLPRNERSGVVYEELQRLARRSQRDLLKRLEAGKAEGAVGHVHSVPLLNGVVVQADSSLLAAVARRRDVDRVLFDREHVLLESDGPGVAKDDPSAAHREDPRHEIPWSVYHIGAPEVWEQGWTGQGVLVGVIDTGVNWQHLDLADHLWDGGGMYPHHGFDFHDMDNDPDDESGHGSRVAGIVAGDGTAGDTTGIAWDATVMCLRVRENLGVGRVSSAWIAQDFCLEHGVDVVSMSLGWGSPGPDDRRVWRQNYEVLDAAGIISVKSAGNNRGAIDPPDAISVPGRVPSPWRHPDEAGFGQQGGQMTVGGVQRDNNIHTVSSPGPVTWQNTAPWMDWDLDGGGLIKPDLVAPAVDGWSLHEDSTAGYGGFANTSMAQPHVAGTVALMLSKNPDLLPAEIDSILQTTAQDLGLAGKDNDFGAGLVRADLAVAAVPLPSNVEGEPGSGERGAALPPAFGIDRVQPNPFNALAHVYVDLPVVSQLKVVVFNTRGQHVDTLAQGLYDAGRHRFTFPGRDLPSGTYFVRATMLDQYSDVEKVILLK